MSTLVAMWARISTGYDPIPPSKEMSYAKNFLTMPTHRYWAIHHL
jgi:citrate synthase